MASSSKCCRGAATGHNFALPPDRPRPGRLRQRERPLRISSGDAAKTHLDRTRTAEKALWAGASRTVDPMSLGGIRLMSCLGLCGIGPRLLAFGPGSVLNSPTQGRARGKVAVGLERDRFPAGRRRRGHCLGNPPIDFETQGFGALDPRRSGQSRFELCRGRRHHPRLPRTRHRHRHGQERPYRPQSRGHARLDGHAGAFRASGRGEPRRSRHDHRATTWSWPFPGPARQAELRRPGLPMRGASPFRSSP